MKNRILLGGLAVFAAIIMVSCNKKEEVVKEEVVVTVDKDKLKTDIQAMENAYADAVNGGNADAVLPYYSDDAMSFSPNKAPIVGKTAIRESIAKDMKEMPKGMKVVFTTNDVFPSSDGNLLVEVGGYKVSDSTNTVKMTGNYMALFEKKDGKYICVRDMAASDMPKEMPKDKK